VKKEELDAGSESTSRDSLHFFIVQAREEQHLREKEL
jgi:hypothetical protein